MSDLREFDPTLKKKKRRHLASSALSHEPLQKEPVIEITEEPKEEILNSDNSINYFGSYLAMLDRIYAEISSEKGFDMVCQRRSLQIPNVGLIGAKKIGWLNFGSTCQCLNRDIDHVMKFCLTELGTTGSIGADGRFVLKGRYRPLQLQSILKKYIAEYVVCTACNGVETVLSKENRIVFKICATCGGKNSVAHITTGFKVQSSRRLEKGV